MSAAHPFVIMFMSLVTCHMTISPGGPRSVSGEEPPYHAPVFVLTHYPHAPD
jgi:hypothetical protein